MSGPGPDRSGVPPRTSPRVEQPAGAERPITAGRDPHPAAELAALALARPPRCGATRLVCVDGPSGSGKTVLAGRLAVELAAPVLHLDDVYPGWDGLAAAVELVRAGVVAPLLAGRAAGHPRWDWERGAPDGHVALGRPPVLVVEGVGSGARAIAARAVLLVFLDAPVDVRYRRAMARDGEAYRPHWARWATQEDAHFAAEGTRARADAVLDGTRWPA